MKTRALAGVCSVILLIAHASCGDKNRTPTAPAVGPPPTPNFQGFSVEGPGFVDIGQTVQYTATARYSDGTSRDVTAEAIWSSSDAKVIQVSSGGVATGTGTGTTRVIGRFSEISRGRSVVVLPPGTFMLRGRVQEARLGVPGATVLVQTGIGAGQSALTTSSGDFTLYGIAGPVRLRVTRDGYVPATADVTVMAHDQAPVIDIVQTSIPALAGTYALNIRAGACQNAVTLPSEAHTRTYVATVQQNGPALEVVLSGAQFLYEPARFTGRVLPEKATFTIYGPDDYYYYYSSRKSEVVERVSSSLIVVSGTLDSAVAAGRLAGQWNGLIRVVQGSDPRGPSRTDCYSSAHQFEFSR